MKVVVVRDDGISDAVHKVIESADGVDSCDEILLSDFVLSHGYFYDNASGCFKAGKKSGEPRRGLEDSLLVNRVVEISKESCLRLADGMFAPTRGQVSHAYANLLKTYVQPCSLNQQYSTVGTLVPLFTQWRVVKEHMPGVSTPEYRYGYGPEIIDADGFDNPIYTTPFHLYDWRPNSPMVGIPLDTFIVERPKGNPLVAFFCGEHVAMRWLDEDNLVNDSIAVPLRKLVLSVKDIFTAFVGESLWFIDEEISTFASFSHRLCTAQHYPELRELISAALIDASDRLTSPGSEFCSIAIP